MLPELPVITRLPEALVFPGTLDLSFEGFSEEAFSILERLRVRPNVQQYREEKEGIDRWIRAPFARYRDDLAVNMVLANRLPFETEKNVFSRLLKNDFGAGGCHHHLWMSFYRTGRKRLTDPQIAHTLDPDGFSVGLYAGDHAGDYLKKIRTRILSDPAPFFGLTDSVLEDPAWQFYLYHGPGEQRVEIPRGAPFTSIEPSFRKLRGLWLRRRFRRADVLAWESALVPNALQSVATLWPVYRYYAESCS